MLIVDDNAINRSILERRLLTLGDAAGGGRRRTGSAIEALADRARGEARRFDWCCSMRNMPDVDGFAVAGAVATRPELAGITIMMLTSVGSIRRRRAVPGARDRGAI